MYVDSLLDGISGNNLHGQTCHALSYFYSCHALLPTRFALRGIPIGWFRVQPSSVRVAPLLSLRTSPSRVSMGYLVTGTSHVTYLALLSGTFKLQRVRQ